jgi:3-methyladenine DNA glycosylase AlkD
MREPTTPTAVLAWLKRHGSKRNVAGMARYGITSTLPVAGVSVGTLRSLAKRLGKDHDLAAELWDAGWYEARMLATLVDEPARVTRGQMNAWAAEFDNWAICDTACFHLFDKTPLAWDQARRWSRSPREFVKRASFALIASLALHDKTAPDSRFRPFLPLIERGAADERNFVKKGVSWALRGVGKRNRALKTAAVAVARRLVRSDDPAARWVGKDALRELVGR